MRRGVWQAITRTASCNPAPSINISTRTVTGLLKFVLNIIAPCPAISSGFIAKATADYAIIGITPNDADDAFPNGSGLLPGTMAPHKGR